MNDNRDPNPSKPGQVHEATQIIFKNREKSKSSGIDMITV